MSQITCKCKRCNAKHKVYFDYESLCEKCFRKHLGELGVKNNILHLIENSKMYHFKVFSYYCLFNLPLALFFYYAAGWIGQAGFFYGLLTGQLSYELSKWCARKF